MLTTPAVSVKTLSGSLPGAATRSATEVEGWPATAGAVLKAAGIGWSADPTAIQPARAASGTAGRDGRRRRGDGDRLRGANGFGHRHGGHSPGPQFARRHTFPTAECRSVSWLTGPLPGVLTVARDRNAAAGPLASGVSLRCGGRHPAPELGSGVDLQFPVDASQVCLDRLGADVQCSRHLPVGEACRG